MLPWIGAAVALAVAGLAVLGVLAWRLWGQVRELGRGVSAASDRLAAATAELQQITPPDRFREADRRDAHGVR